MNIIFSATIFSVAWSTLVEAEPVEEEERRRRVTTDYYLGPQTPNQMDTHLKMWNPNAFSERNYLLEAAFYRLV